MRRSLSVALASLLLAACAQSPVERVKQTLTLKAQAEAHYAKRDCAKAIPLYEKLNREMPNFNESLLRIGNCHVFLNDLDTAVVAYRQALSRDPGYLKAWHNLTRVQARILGETVAEMYRNVDMTDPMAAEVRQFALEVLDAFEPSKQNPDDTEAARLSGSDSPGTAASAGATSSLSTAE